MERSNSFSSTNVSYQQLDHNNDNETETQDDHQYVQPSQTANVSNTDSNNAFGIPSSTLSQHPKITICFRTLSGQVMRIELPTFLDAAGSLSVFDLTVFGLKQELERAHQIPVHFQRLIFGGRELTDEQSLRGANIEDQSMIHLLLRQAQVAPGANPLPQSNMAVPGFDHQAIEMVEPMGAYSEDVDLIYQLGRSIKILCLFDTLWLILIAMRMYLFNLGLILAVVGIVGAHMYRRDLTVALLGFICLAIASRIWYMTENEGVPIIILWSLAILIDLYLLRLIVIFIKKLKHITPDDRLELLRRNRLRWG